MATHPLWRPFELVDLDQVATVRVGTPKPRTITVVPYHAGWPASYAAVERRVRDALGETVLSLDHEMDYNDHKGALVYDLYEKIFTADPAHEHDAQPRS